MATFRPDWESQPHLQNVRAGFAQAPPAAQPQNPLLSPMEQTQPHDWRKRWEECKPDWQQEQAPAWSAVPDTTAQPELSNVNAELTGHHAAAGFPMMNAVIGQLQRIENAQQLEKGSVVQVLQNSCRLYDYLQAMREDIRVGQKHTKDAKAELSNLKAGLEDVKAQLVDVKVELLENKADMVKLQEYVVDQELPAIVIKESIDELRRNVVNLSKAVGMLCEQYSHSPEKESLHPEQLQEQDVRAGQEQVQDAKDSPIYVEEQQATLKLDPPAHSGASASGGTSGPAPVSSWTE